MNTHRNTHMDIINRVVERSQLHVMYDGYSNDIDFEALDIGDLSTDTEVRTAVATYLDVPVAKMQNFTVDRNVETGDMTLRPQATFGRLL